MCRDMDLVESALRPWVGSSKRSAGRPGVGKPLTLEQQGIRRPELGSATEADNEILKASTFFAQELK